MPPRSPAPLLAIALPLVLLVSASLSRAAEPTVKLDALVTEVTSRHPELAFYEAEIAAAKAGARTAATRADPELSLSAGHKRVRDAAGALVGEGTAWSVSLTQTFEWPGRLALRKALPDGRAILLAYEQGPAKGAVSVVVETLAP